MPAKVKPRFIDNQTFQKIPLALNNLDISIITIQDEIKVIILYTERNFFIRRQRLQQAEKHVLSVAFKGHIAAVRGTVVDVSFTNDLPPINGLLHNTSENKISLEVIDHIDEHTVRCIGLTPTAGLGRGELVQGSGDPIKVPVVEKCLGRMFNVFGKTIDNKNDPVDTEKRSGVYAGKRRGPQLEHLRQRGRAPAGGGHGGGRVDPRVPLRLRR